MDLIPYHKKHVLIIEDLAEMRSSMKSMLANIGVQHIETANTGEEALKKLRNNQYDIIFSDYELGRGKDGQQILEEVRFANLIKAQAVYILVTAAQTMDFVMGALEYEPDGYITKPVTLEILRSRLNRIVRTKEVYREINRGIDANDINRALDACNRLAVEKPKFALPAYRIKGKILLDNKRYEEAKDIYDTVLGIKRVAWAILGMGKVQYHLGEYDEAQELLESLAKTKAKYVEAHDWLAKVLEMQGKYKAAQKVLMEAVENSPKVVSRQQNLGRIAELNGDMEVMWKAYRKAVSLGQNSCFAQAEPYIGLAKSLQPKIKGGSMRDKKLCTSEALNLIEHARTNFELNTMDSLKCALVEAETLFNSGKELEGKLAYQAAQSIMENSADLTMDNLLDAFNARLKFEEESEAFKYGERLLSDIGNNKRLQIKYYKVIEAYLAGQPERRLEMMKKRGEELIERDDTEDAIELLERATALKVADDETRLMLLKAYTAKFAKGRSDMQQLEDADVLAKQLAAVAQENPLFPTVERCLKQWKEVSGGNEQ